MPIEKFEDLDVWQEAHRLVLRVYKMTNGMPADERFGLISQMRRAAVAVPANIAKGFKQLGAGDKVRFYNSAQGSLEELHYFFILCRDLQYQIEYDSLNDRVDHIGRMLTKLIHSIRG